MMNFMKSCILEILSQANAVPVAGACVRPRYTVRADQRAVSSVAARAARRSVHGHGGTGTGEMRGALPLGLCKLSLVTQTRRLRPKVNHDSHALVTLLSHWLPRMQVDP